MMLNVVIFLLLAGLNCLTSFIKHDYLEIHLALFVDLFVPFMLKKLEICFILNDHLFFDCFIFLVKFKCLFLINCKRSELALDLVCDGYNIVGVEELVFQQGLALSLWHWVIVASMEATATGVSSLQIAKSIRVHND